MSALQHPVLQRLNSRLWRAVWAGHQQSPGISKALDFVGLGCDGTVFYVPAQSGRAAAKCVPASRLDLDSVDPTKLLVFACSIWHEKCHGCPWHQGVSGLIARNTLGLQSQADGTALQAKPQPGHTHLMVAQVGDFDAQPERHTIHSSDLGHHPQPCALGVPNQPSVNHAEHCTEHGNAQSDVVQHGLDICSHGRNVAQEGGAA